MKFIDGKPRCNWIKDHSLYLKYHDEEWGVPIYDDHKLFELLVLESAEAGLSWLTILKKRASYRLAYDNFDPEKLSLPYKMLESFLKYKNNTALSVITFGTTQAGNPF